MQDIVFYVAAGDALGICKDSYGNQTVAAPSVIRGGEVRLRMRLLAGDGTDTPLPVDPLLECVSWEWVMDSDWDDSTPSKLIADNASITVSDVTEDDGEEEKHFTEVVIPIPEMNTQELKDYLASKETATLNGELCGYGEDAKILFLLQVKGFTVRNRIAPSAPPTELADQFLDEAGVRALIDSIAQGPPGEKGDPGEQGPQGPQGEPGDPNVAESMVDEKISAHNQNSSAHPDKLPLSGGTLTGELKSTAYNAFRMIQGEYGTFFRNDGRNLYILITNAGDQNGSYNDFRPFTINLSTGQCDINGKAVYDGKGNNIANTYVRNRQPIFNNGIEILGDLPYIDFHFNSDTRDYTSRIYETAAGALTVVAKLSVSGGIAPRYNAQTDLTSAYTSGGNSHTFTGGGWLYAVTSAGGAYAINGGTVVSAASGATASCCVPVNKGDTVTGSAAGTLIFYPY